MSRSTGSLAPLGQRNFAWYFSSRLVNTLGAVMANIALTFAVLDIDGRAIAKHLTDVVSRGGRLLLNVGPTADGTIPPVQQRALEGLGRWMRGAAELLRSSDPVPVGTARSSDEPWTRWLAVPGAQPLPASFETYFGDVRAGAVRGGLYGSAMTQEFLDFERRHAAELGMLCKVRPLLRPAETVPA